MSAARRDRKPRVTLQADVTPERLAKAAGAIVYGDNRQGTRITHIRDSVVERAHARRAINAHQLAAAKRYREHWEASGLLGHMPSLDPGKPGGPGEATVMPANEWQAHHREAYRRARDVLERCECLHTVELIVCAEEALWPAGTLLGWRREDQAVAASVERLRIGLNALCRLWGL